MEKQSGISGIAAMKPTSVDDLAILNSAIRLMATEKGGEMPVNKLARFKAHPSDWDYELKKYGLGAEAKEILEPVLNVSYGLCIAQEQFMQLVQLPELGGFNLTWADKLRKSIAKKNPAEYDKLTDEYFKTIKEKEIPSDYLIDHAQDLKFTYTPIKDSTIFFKDRLDYYNLQKYSWKKSEGSYNGL